jgi:hypothetical protein
MVTEERQPRGNPYRPRSQCWSCPHRQPPRPAAYLWTCKISGNTVRLCVECCAYWRATARDEPDLAASAIRQIRTAP